jgi:hypothetical protein
MAFAARLILFTPCYVSNMYQRHYGSPRGDPQWYSRGPL